MGKNKILIIDDEVEFASTLCQRLSLRGFEAHDVYCGKDGIVAVKEKKPEIVILDLKMKDMSGLDVLDEIKRFDTGIEVIMLTGHGGTDSCAEAQDKGAFDYIMKPIDLNELLKKIESAAKKHS